MRHFFKERIVLSFQNTFSDIFLFSWSYPYDRVKNIEGYYRNFTDYFITKTASEERVPIDDISVTRSIVKNEDGESEEERDFTFDERLRIQNLDRKSKGLQDITYENIKEELYNAKLLCTK